MKDLFDTPEQLPKEVREIIDSFDYDADAYQECKRVHIDLLYRGYTFEYGLDGEPYNLSELPRTVLLVDGNSCSLSNFIYINTEDPNTVHLSKEEIDQVKNLKLNESVFLGMGVEVKRVI